MATKRGLEQEEGGASEEGGVKRVCAEPENGRPGDWLCPSCNHHNWSFRDICQKCFTNKDGVQTAEQPQKPGDWNCPNCAHLNYAFRHTCQRCHTPKPYKAAGGGPGSQDGGRPGDWTCPNCGDLCYASRSACRKCATPKPMGMMPGMPNGNGYVSSGYGMPPLPGMGPMGMPPMPPMPGFGGKFPGGPRAAPKETRPGDWACPKCYDINYASRSVCRLCGAGKPANGAFGAEMYGYDMGAYGNPDMFGFTMGMTGGGAGGSRRPGDWDCPNCGDVNYASRSECRKCKTPRPEHLGSAMGFKKPGNNGLGASRRSGDWDCPNCGDVNYASRTECRKCKTPRSAAM